MSRKVLASVFSLAILMFGQDRLPSPAKPGESPVPKMSRLAKALVGDWDTTETMERSTYFPNGGKRSGVSRWRLAVGGTIIVGEGDSDGSAGHLAHMLLIWWDNQAKTYGYFVCFKDTGSSCQARGTAHWEMNAFVNDYEEMEDGRATKWRDSFTDITPNSYALIAGPRNANGTIKEVITTRSIRRK